MCPKTTSFLCNSTILLHWIGSIFDRLFRRDASASIVTDGRCTFVVLVRVQERQRGVSCRFADEDSNPFGSSCKPFPSRIHSSSFPRSCPLPVTPRYQARRRRISRLDPFFLLRPQGWIAFAWISSHLISYLLIHGVDRCLTEEVAVELLDDGWLAMLASMHGRLHRHRRPIETFVPHRSSCSFPFLSSWKKRIS